MKALQINGLDIVNLVRLHVLYVSEPNCNNEMLSVVLVVQRNRLDNKQSTRYGCVLASVSHSPSLRYTLLYVVTHFIVSDD